MEVTPSLLNLAPGESADVEISLSTDGTIFDAWQFGSVTWTGAEGSARSPVAIRALPFAAPVLIEEAGSEGNTTIALEVGYSGSYEAVLSGFEATGQSQSDGIQAQLTNSVADDPDDAYEFIQPTAGTPPGNVRRIPLEIPAGTRYLRVALTNQNSSPGADLDLYLYYCPNFSTCTARGDASVGDEANEVINIVPAAGEEFITPGAYYVDVHGLDVPTGNATFRLFVWAVGTDRGNASVLAPASVSSGTVESVGLTWQGLQSGLHLGLITHGNGSAVLDQTVIEITVP
jgi:hypothetical protein